MSEPAHTMPVRNKKPRRIIAVLLAFVGGLTVLLLWFAGAGAGNSDPLFHGKPESVWIKELKYNDDEQVKAWRSYSVDGVQVLIRGLQRANRSGERLYRQVSRRLPGFAMRWLPSPKDDSTRSTRMCLVSLLASLGNDAKSATPIMIRTVIRDEDASVRQSVINFFTTSEDEKCLLNQLFAD